MGAATWGGGAITSFGTAVAIGNMRGGGYSGGDNNDDENKRPPWGCIIIAIFVILFVLAIICSII